MMKNVSVKILAGVGALSIAAAIYSFASNNEPDKKQDERKKYEVIRMVDGEMMQFDTIVDVSSNYTPQDYLNDLGFSEDKNISIIDVNNCFMDIDHFGNIKEDGGDHHVRIEKNIAFDENGKVLEGDLQKGEKRIYIEIDEESDTKEGENGEVRIEKRIVLDENGNEITIQHDHSGAEIEQVIIDENGNIVKNDGDEEIRIEKKIIINKDGSESEEITVDVESMMENLNFDSLIQVAMKMEGMEGDSHNVFIHKMIVLDEEFDGDFDKDFEWHSVDTDGASFHKEVRGPGHHMEVAVWGEDQEDFTLVIVSNPDEEPIRTNSTDENISDTEVKLFPNPSSESTQLQLNFADKAKTTVSITDMQGKVVANMDLGKFKGQFNHDIEVKGWESGVYLIHITHGDEKIIEKLIVE